MYTNDVTKSIKTAFNCKCEAEITFNLNTLRVVIFPFFADFGRIGEIKGAEGT